MAKTRRDLILAVRNKLEQKLGSVVDNLGSSKVSLSKGMELEKWLDTEISEEEYERRLAEPIPKKAFKTLLDPILFPSASKLTVEGRN